MPIDTRISYKENKIDTQIVIIISFYLCFGFVLKLVDNINQTHYTLGYIFLTF